MNFNRKDFSWRIADHSFILTVKRSLGAIKEVAGRKNDISMDGIGSD